jgi:hypothetical protein
MKTATLLRALSQARFEQGKMDDDSFTEADRRRNQADRFEAEILRRIERDEKRWAKVPKSFRRIAGDLCEMDKEGEK